MPSCPWGGVLVQCARPVPLLMPLNNSRMGRLGLWGLCWVGWKCCHLWRPKASCHYVGEQDPPNGAPSDPDTCGPSLTQSKSGFAQGLSQVERELGVAGKNRPQPPRALATSSIRVSRRLQSRPVATRWCCCSVSLKLPDPTPPRPARRRLRPGPPPPASLCLGVLRNDSRGRGQPELASQGPGAELARSARLCSAWRPASGRFPRSGR